MSVNKIERGLFKYDFIDYHAILCVSVDADVKFIRKRYLNIVRRLHPDSLKATGEEEKKLANQLLSKLVNPAYETLSAERNRAEYVLILSQMGKRLAEESTSVELTSDMAKELTTTPNVEHAYKTAIAKIAQTQYNSLEQATEIIAQISELNLVYLMRTAGKTKKASPPPPPPPSNSNTPKPPTANKSSGKKPPVPANEDSAIVQQYIRRAQDLMGKNQLASARVELQDALKLAPNNSTCHSLIGVVYLKQNQTTMAKVHFDRALQLDPKDETASAGKRKIEQMMGHKPGNAKSKTSANTGGKQPDKSEGGGLFGGLFGGKKK
ncbi:MAG: DnaJ domain-containing protein [Nostocaceae cyanobacterium]|nr:DnaJ domain-containing protein [Nostocaceae cyanobacterium]